MKLFQPVEINGMRLKNRVVLAPMVVIRKPSLNEKDSEYIDHERPYYVERAMGGAGAIITGAMTVTRFTSDEVWGQPGSIEVFLRHMKNLVNDVHRYDAKIGPQLWFTNRFPSGTPHPSAVSRKEEWIAPSGRTETAPDGYRRVYIRPGREFRELTTEEIRWIVGQFAAAALGVKEAGFDFLEFHGAHGHLANEFFSPINNRRSDEYGGNLTKRMRFGLECIEAIRKNVGPNFPIFFRLGAEDDCTGGITLADSIAYAVELEKAGVDCFNVSVGISTNRPYRFYISPSKGQPMGTYAHLAAAVKQKVHAPVIAVGRINSPEMAERILNEGQADLVAIGRQLIADPFWPQKVKEGRIEDIVQCDGCNTYCYHDAPAQEKTTNPPSCRKNKRAGKEWQIPRA